MEEKKAFNRLTTTREIGQMVSRHYEDLNKAHQEGRSVAWCFGSVPSLILRAANVSYLWGNQYGASASARGLEKELHDAAEKAGYSRSLCSYCRSNIGASMLIRGVASPSNADPYYSIPVPDLLVSLNPHCHINMYWMDVLRRQFNCPVFYFEFPHEWEHTESETEQAIALAIREHQNFISFLEDVSHRKFDWEGLKNLMGVAKKAGVARHHAMELCKNTPSPATYFDWLNSLAPVNLLAGAPGTDEVMENMKKEIEGRVVRKEGAILNEKYRLYYDGIGPYPVLGQASRKFADLGANVVCGRYVNLGFYSDPEKFDPNHPLETLSEGLCRDFQLNWNLDHMAERVIELCKEYRVDGLVFQITKTCRSTSNREMELLDMVSSTLDLPAVVMEGDQTDRSYYHMNDMFAQVEALLGAIDARGRHKRR